MLALLLFGLPCGDVSSLCSPSQCSASSICFSLSGSTLDLHPQSVGPLCSSILHLLYISSSGLHLPFCSGISTLCSPSHSVSMSTLCSTPPCSSHFESTSHLAICLSLQMPWALWQWLSAQLAGSTLAVLSARPGVTLPLIHVHQSQGFDFTHVYN
jgi:hypothetical protein